MTNTQTAKTPAKKRNIKTAGKVAAAVKPKPVKAAAPTVAPAPKVNAHVEAGVKVSAYAGLSSFINANRRTKIMVRDTRPTGSLTERMQKTLYALRGAYDAGHFNVKGLDNGVMSNLAAAGLVSLSGGQTETIDGKAYMVDAEAPVKAMVTKAGREYGKA
jgi:hypothetical protein